MKSREWRALRRAVLGVFMCSLLIVIIGCFPHGSSANAPSFDETRAFDLLNKQVGFGPRYPGTDGHKNTAEFIQEQLKPHADIVHVQEFHKTIRGKDLDMKNIIATFNPSAKKQVLLAAHWDTRPTADMEVNSEKRKQPISGANDGASGVAVLLELARMFAKQKPDIGVTMVFFDGEDYGPGGEDMFLGSRYFAANLSDELKPNSIKYCILLDMIGDKDLEIPKEQNSVASAPDVIDNVWNTAKKLGYGDVFNSEIGMRIQDDHVPLIKAGVKCIDLIDFDYGPWHTLDDAPDKCSPKSLKIVGEVVANVVYEEK